MPKGIANLFSTLSCIDLFKIIEYRLSEKGIKLELPETGKVQLWNSEGDMIKILKEDFITILPEISSYLVQFWWPQMDDVSLKISCEGSLSECNIYLDGLNDCQIIDIFDLLISIALDNTDIIGVVIDRQELFLGYDWSKLFSGNSYISKQTLEEKGLKVYNEYVIKRNHEIQLNEFLNNVCVLICNHERKQVTIYLLH